jgi:hypothetical protein
VVVGKPSLEVVPEARGGFLEEFVSAATMLPFVAVLLASSDPPRIL